MQLDVGNEPYYYYYFLRYEFLKVWQTEGQTESDAYELSDMHATLLFHASNI